MKIGIWRMISIALLLLSSVAVVRAEAPPPPEVSLVPLEGTPPALPENDLSPGDIPPEALKMPSVALPCLYTTAQQTGVLISKVGPETEASICVTLPSPEKIEPDSCPYTQYRIDLYACGTCGGGKRIVTFWRRTVDPCWGYVGPWEYIRSDCWPC